MRPAEGEGGPLGWAEGQVAPSPSRPQPRRNPFVALPALTELEATVIRDLLGVALGMNPPPLPAPPQIVVPTLWSLHTAFAEAIANHDPMEDT